MPKFRHGYPTRETSLAPQRAKLAEAASARAASPHRLLPGAMVQRAMAAPHALRPAELIAMQRTLGNRAVGAMLGRQPVQGKRIVNAPGDKYEREADRIAEQVMRMPAPPQAEPEDAENRQIIAQPAVPRSGHGAAFAAGEGFEQQLDASRGRGQPLPSALQTEFEAKFGADFSGVRVHCDAEAGELSAAIQAQAFTHGSDIYFAAGKPTAHAPAAKRLLAHELAHVVQQGAARAETRPAPQVATPPKAAARPRGLFASGSLSVVGQPRGVYAPALPQSGEPKVDCIVQRKIEERKLNLVGEDHDESHPRREQERQMLKEHYGFSTNQYWTEGEFKDDQDTYGDPKDLRALQAAVFMLESNEDAKKDQKSFYDYFRMFKNGVEEYEKQQHPANNDLITDATHIINSISAFSTVVQREQLEGWRNSIRLMLNKYVFAPGNEFDRSVRVRRSEDMFRAAQRSNKIGVWKVGDFHIGDLRGSAVGNKTTLTSETEFNMEYEGWFRENINWDLSEINFGASDINGPAIKTEERLNEPPVKTVEDLFDFSGEWWKEFEIK